MSPGESARRPVVPRSQADHRVDAECPLRGSLTHQQKEATARASGPPPEASSSLLKSSRSSGLWFSQRLPDFPRKHIVFLVNGVVSKCQFAAVRCSSVEAQRVALHSPCILQSCLNHSAF